MEPKKESKKAVCDVKVKLIKLEGGTAAPPPRGRENSRVRIGASAIRPLEYFPYGLASPARADCIGVPRGHGWVREAGVAIGDCWETHLPKGFSLRRGSAAGGGEV